MSAEESASALFTALADPTRCLIVRHLATNGPDTATGLATRFERTRQAVSKHLAVLSGAALVCSERAGRERRYRLNPAPLAEARAWIARTEALWDDALGRLERYLADEDTDPPRQP